MEYDENILEAVNDVVYEGYDIQDVVIALEKHPETINEQDPHGYTALMKAIVQDRIDVFDLLLQCEHIDINIQKDDWYTALMHTTCNRIDMCSKLLLFDSINLELNDYKGKTALIRAIEYGSIDIIKMLLRRGALLENGMGFIICPEKEYQIRLILNIWGLPKWSKFTHKQYIKRNKKEFDKLIMFYLCLFKRLNLMFKIHIPKEIQQMLLSYILTI